MVKKSQINRCSLLHNQWQNISKDEWEQTNYMSYIIYEAAKKATEKYREGYHKSKMKHSKKTKFSTSSLILDKCSFNCNVTFYYFWSFQIHFAAVSVYALRCGLHGCVRVCVCLLSHSAIIHGQHSTKTIKQY